MARKRPHSPAQSTAHGERQHARHVDSDKQTANTERQQMLALRPLLTKQKSSDKEVEQFRTEVEADYTTLNALLQRRLNQAESDEKRRHGEITRAACEALQLPNRSRRNDASAYTDTRIASNAICASLNDIMVVSEGLITEYQRLDSIIENLQDENTESMVESWRRNIEKTEEQLKAGARVAQRNVLKALGADVQHDEGKIAHGNGDGDIDASEGSGGKDSNMELQKTLKYAERAVKKMVKGLPNDDSV